MEYSRDHYIPQCLEQGYPTHDQDGLGSKLQTHDGQQEKQGFYMIQDGLGPKP